MENLDLHIEAIIFASEASVSLGDIQQTIQVISNDSIEGDVISAAINHIEAKYNDPYLPICLVNTGGGYQFLTKKDYHKTIRQLQIQRSKKRLSQATLETLAIIAYRQPVTKVEIEQIRGVNCDYSIQKLLEKELVSISGKANTPGKPILYSTSDLFMDHFGINSTLQLPQLKDIVNQSNEIGDSLD